MSKKRLARDVDETAFRQSKKSKDNDQENPILKEAGLRVRREDYTVGWICAITTEYVAAQAFLDEEHEGPDYIAQNDNNDYTLGKVGKHNVVVAVLPDGEYGTSSAASVARDMLHSFPNIRIGLMVGIGGGAPSPKHDIRLGDIVVSTPRDGKGGVFQYDFGKTIQGQSFQQTQFLNQPPTALRTTVNGLKAQHERKGHQLKEAINSILKENPRLRKKYMRPDPSSDRLYQTRVTHPLNDEASCAVVCSNNPLNLVSRLERTQDEDNPAIYYGLIASANQLMKDALVRDRLAAEKDVLCFEMEAAGLMNQFPCLVIRGICDYSDTHKNKEWQGYAAMAAAAYANDLLHRIAPNMVENEKKVVDILSGVLDSISRTEAIIETTRAKLEHTTILNWLTPIDYGPQQSNYFRKRQAGTGQWLLESKEFQTWYETSKRTLFCPGIPGAGKTILTSIVIDHLITWHKNNPDIGIAYLYCNFQQREKQQAEDLLASLLKQLSKGWATLPVVVKDLYTQHDKHRTRPLLNEISRVLQSVAAMYSRVFVVVDALDECQPSDGCRLKLLSEMFNLQTETGVNLFATSRDIPEITVNFEGNAKLWIRAREEDVRTYLDHHMLPRRTFLKKNLHLQEEIKAGIVKAVKGMFLLAVLHLASLMDKTTEDDIQIALDRLPTGAEAYDLVYKSAMERIEEQDADGKGLAKRVLLWITCARRPLTVTELQHALATEVSKSGLNKKRQPHVEDMVSVSAGLVTVDEGTNVIRLVHYTTQQYFEQTWKLWFPNAQTDIAKTCITYLSFNAFGTGFCLTDEEFEARLQSNALYDYAARNWGNHAHGNLGEVEELIVDFLKSEARVAASSQAMIVSQDYLFRGYSQRVPRQIKGAHLAVYFGSRDILKALLEDGSNPDPKDADGRTPLSWAAKNGHEAVVRLLLAKDRVDPDSKDSSGRTPLLWAVEKRNEAVVKLLLEEDRVNPNSKANNGWTPLLWAAENGHEAVVRLLLAKDRVDPDSKDSSGRTPLSWAAENGHEAVVRLLLAKDRVDPDSKDNSERTPLSWAVEKKNEAVVKLLLEKDRVNPNSQDNSGWTPLSWAVGYVCEAVVNILLSRDDINANSKDKDSWTPLSLAAQQGHMTMAKLLLTKDGIDADSKDGHGRTPLWWAARYGHEAVVKLLLEKGADPDPKDSYGRTALQWAARNGHKAVVKLLLAKDAGNGQPKSIQYNSLNRIETLDLTGLGRRRLSQISCVSEDGNYAAVLAVWPSLDFETFCQKGWGKASNFNIQKYSIGWRARYEIYSITKTTGERVYSAAIPLSQFEVMMQLGRSLQPGSGELKLNFPLSIHPDLSTIVVLRSIYWMHGKPDNGHCRLFCSPTILPLDYDDNIREIWPSDSGKWNGDGIVELHDNLMAKQTYQYEILFGCGHRSVVFRDYDSFKSSASIAVFQLHSASQPYKASLRGFFRHGNIHKSCLHPKLPILCFSSLSGASSRLYIWNFGDDTCRLNLVYAEDSMFPTFEGMSFSSCGAYIITTGSGGGLLKLIGITCNPFVKIEERHYLVNEQASPVKGPRTQTFWETSAGSRD